MFIVGDKTISGGDPERVCVGHPIRRLSQSVDGWRQDGIFKGLHRKLDFGRIQFNAIIYGVFVWDLFPFIQHWLSYIYDYVWPGLYEGLNLLFGDMPTMGCCNIPTTAHFFLGAIFYAPTIVNLLTCSRPSGHKYNAGQVIKPLELPNNKNITIRWLFCRCLVGVTLYVNEWSSELESWQCLCFLLGTCCLAEQQCLIYGE